MESLYLSFKVVAPLFVIMAVGYWIKRLGWVSESTVNQMNSVNFKVFLSLSIFLSIYKADMAGCLNPGLMLFCAVGVLVVFALLMAIVPRVEPDRTRCSSYIQGIYRSNFVIFGLTIATSIYGPDNIGVNASLVIIISPLFNVLASFLFEYFQGEKMELSHLLKKVVTNPFIIASMAGLFFQVAGFALPELAVEILEEMAGVGTPLALIILGMSFTFEGFQKYASYLWKATLLRLVVIPGVMIGLAILLGFRAIELVTVLSVFGTPTAIASFAMAKSMGGDAELAGQIVVVTSVCCIATIFGWVYLLSSAGLL